ncbi:hypothetical protein CEP52_006204 [Fusarium oligoseptatum]|uniref:Sec1 family protein n=1 Tax=Fusarium oligoseptatum TaxID=2604345 RepID=A0A428TTY3_9HYPO|nr:hypothetical protein CEP52_006204 [Fusarium oligoseptatum]
MLAGLPQFQEMKEAYSLHLTMAQECMNIFQKHKLMDISNVEQTLATGLDEDFRRPKNVLDTVVRLLDDEAVSLPDRLRLIVMFILYRDGVIQEDIKRLIAHSNLQQTDCQVIENFAHLGGLMTHGLKDVRQPPPPLFPIDTKATQLSEEYGLARYEPALKHMLDALARGVLEQTHFPYVKPPLDPNEDLLIAQGGSLRAGRPNWAAAGRRPPENRQRIIVFMAGGATYSESRACYEVGAEKSRDIILATSHMLSPQLFVRQVSDLSRDKRQLDLPLERPKRHAPAHLYERPAPPRPPPQQQAPPQQPGGPARRPIQGGLPSQPRPGNAPPTAAMGNMSLNPHGGSNGASRPNSHHSSSGYHQEDGGKIPQREEAEEFPGYKEVGLFQRECFLRGCSVVAAGSAVRYDWDRRFNRGAKEAWSEERWQKLFKYRPG